MRNVRRALALGAAFGLAAATVETWGSLIPFIQRRFGPGPGFAVQVAALDVALGALLGLLAAPLLRLRAGALLHLAAVALAWYGIERWVPLEAPSFKIAELMPPVGGLALALLGLAIARWRPALPWALGAALFAAGAIAPQIYLRATTPEAPPLPARGTARAGAPDVVLVVLDTVRADHVSAYGYARATAPDIDALASEGALFLDATSPSTWSLPSHASLFTGRYPSSHGAHGEHVFLDARYPTLAEALQKNGYDTACFTANPWISDGLGLTRGFDSQDESVKTGGGAGRSFTFAFRLLDRLGLLDADKGGAGVAEHFAAWTRARPKEGRPFFAFLNFIESHFPYHQLPHDALRRFTDRPYSELRAISIDLMAQQFGGRPRPLAEVQGPAIDMYDGGVVHASRLLGRVVGALRERGTLDDTVVVVLADHGEILGERGGYFGHGPALYQEGVHVPLVVRYPARVPAGVRVASPVTTLSVAATVLDLAGLEPLPTFQTTSLAPLTTDPSRSAGPILSELHPMKMDGAHATGSTDPLMQTDRRYRVFRDGALKLVEASTGERWLFDLAADPGETRDVAAERPADLAIVAAHLHEVSVAIDLPALDRPLLAEGEQPDVDDATRERLQALGYVE
jgi:arylsulfatase A-like enzyme